MGFGRNQFVAKAEAAEQKAADAPDDIARVRALREAAHEWDRAADREKPGSRREEYLKNAARNRAEADGEPAEELSSPEEAPTERLELSAASPAQPIVLDPRQLN